MKFKSVCEDLFYVRDTYKFDFSTTNALSVDPAFAERMGQHYIGIEIDVFYDGDVELCEGEDGALYGVVRDWVGAPIDGEYPVVIWQRMVKR